MLTAKEVALHLREGIGARQADLLAEWMLGVEERLGSTTTTTVVADLHALAAKLDADEGVTDTDYAATLTTPAGE